MSCGFGGNVLVEFLLATCATEDRGHLLVDSHLFFNSVLVTLKRIKNSKTAHFNAEMFIVDHFWNSCFPSNTQGGLSPTPHDRESIASPATEETAENVHVNMDLF